MTQFSILKKNHQKKMANYFRPDGKKQKMTQ
jgi:hypothetical protein